jgi:hypothetical protein
MFTTHTHNEKWNFGKWEGIEALEARELLSASPAHDAAKALVHVAKTPALHVVAQAKSKATITRSSVAAVQPKTTKANVVKKVTAVSKAAVQPKAVKVVAGKKTAVIPVAVVQNTAIDACRGEAARAGAVANATSGNQAVSLFGTNPIQSAQDNMGKRVEPLDNPLDRAQSAFPDELVTNPDGIAPSPTSTLLDKLLAASGPDALIEELAAAGGITSGPASVNDPAGLASGQGGISLQSASDMLGDFQQSFRGGLSANTLGDSRLMEGDGTSTEPPPEPPVPTPPTDPEPPAPTPAPEDPKNLVCGTTVDGNTQIDGKRQGDTVKLTVGKIWAAVCAIVGGTCVDGDGDNASNAVDGVRGMPNPEASDPHAELPDGLAAVLAQSVAPSIGQPPPVDPVEPSDDQNRSVGKQELSDEHRLDPVINNGENGRSESDSSLIVPAVTSPVHVTPQDTVKNGVERPDTPKPRAREMK